MNEQQLREAILAITKAYNISNSPKVRRKLKERLTILEFQLYELLLGHKHKGD